MNLKSLLSLCFGLFVSLSLSAQQTDAFFQGLPTKSENGRCYAKCKLPDCRVALTKTVMVKEGYTNRKTTPAVYETSSEEVLIKEASTKLVVVPAEYETVTEQVLIKEASTKIVQKTPKYQTTTERIMVSPEHGKWVKKKRTPSCFSSNPEDCYVMCWEKIPAKYKTVEKRVLVDSGTSEIVEIPAQYKTIQKRVLRSPASTKIVEIPAEYKTVKTQRLASPVGTFEEYVPAKYETVEYFVTADQGGYTTWTEVLCQEKTTSGIVRKVQQALIDKGYKPGSIDGVMGGQTKAALEKFQQDKALPEGNLNMETLTALGLKVNK